MTLRIPDSYHAKTLKKTHTPWYILLHVHDVFTIMSNAGFSDQVAINAEGVLSSMVT